MTVDAAQIVVIDGDTIEVNKKRVRLVGYDAPELKGSCSAEREGAIKAASRLRELIAAGRVELELHDLRRKSHSRIIGRMLVDGVDVAIIMIREGLAVPYEPGFGRKRWCRPGG